MTALCSRSRVGRTILRLHKDELWHADATEGWEGGKYVVGDDENSIADQWLLIEVKVTEDDECTHVVADAGMLRVPASQPAAAQPETLKATKNRRYWRS